MSRCREWIIPANRESWLTRELDEADILYDPVINGKHNSNDVDVSIEKKKGRLQLSFNKYCEEYPLFRAIANSEYDRKTRILSFPENQKKNLLNVLKDAKVTYSFSTANETNNIEKSSSLKKTPVKRISKRSVRSIKQKAPNCKINKEEEKNNGQEDTEFEAKVDEDEEEAEVDEEEAYMESSKEEEDN